jgi:O-acetyl-ADP-ribose deacetylase (regulator of RNase III)
MIKRGTGNLLLAPVQALVNTVNTEGVMGKGIALQFRDAFTEMYQRYVEDCKAKRVQLGKMNVFDRGALVTDGARYVINFPTKGHWRSKSRLLDIESGLQDLARVIRDLDIRSIAIPPLGCGNGGLKWSDVRPLIEQTFAELADVEALVFEPVGAPPAADMPRATTKPPMSQSRAVLILLIDRYLKGLLDPFVTLLEVHKLMYFMQEAGQPLKLEYEAAKYGPYARNLRFELLRMEGHYTVGFGDGVENPEKQLELLSGAVDEAHDFLARKDDVNKRLDRVTNLIDGFADSYGMELLSTVHWVMAHNTAARADGAVAVREVQQWSSRKRGLMKPGHLLKAWQRLAKGDWNLNSASIDRMSVAD